MKYIEFTTILLHSDTGHADINIIYDLLDLVGNSKGDLKEIESVGVDKPLYILPNIFKITKYMLECDELYLLDSRCSILPIIQPNEQDLKQYLHQECNEVISMEAADFHFNYVNSTKYSVSNIIIILL